MSESSTEQTNGESSTEQTNDRRHASRRHDPCEPTKGGRLHEHATSWCDTCTCEAEPRWREVGEACGIDPDA
ncbi:MAG: hypothetical protein ACOC1G_09165 [Phycisphaeraceae bacterium]